MVVLLWVLQPRQIARPLQSKHLEMTWDRTLAGVALPSLTANCNGEDALRLASVVPASSSPSASAAWCTRVSSGWLRETSAD